jgi:hypothetical protein
MVIHDLRSPTNQVQYLAKQLLNQMNEIKSKYILITQANNVMNNSVSAQIQEIDIISGDEGPQIGNFNSMY